MCPRGKACFAFGGSGDTHVLLVSHQAVAEEVPLVKKLNLGIIGAGHCCSAWHFPGPVK